VATEKPNTIDQYLASLPADQAAALSGLRDVVLTIVPDAAESISYGMPTFKYRGKPLIYFAAAKHHCAIYGTSAGTVRFPASEPLSEEFLRPLLEERVRETDAKTRGKTRPTSGH
jgi:uncharacterized protein YdhG (YjbR/CyaY superfamily)